MASLLRGLLMTASLVCPLWAQGADDCANAPAIAGTGTWAIDTSTATTDGAPDILCEYGSSDDIPYDFWYRWTAQASGDYVFYICTQVGFFGERMAIYGDLCPPEPALECRSELTCDQVAHAVALTAVVQGET